MSDAGSDLKFSTSTPTPAIMKPARLRKEEESTDWVIAMARKAVADNYNSLHIAGLERNLKPEDVQVMWVANVLSNWKCFVTSTIIRGLIWQVTYNRARSEAYVEIFKKLKNTKVTIDMNGDDEQ